MTAVDVLEHEEEDLLAATLAVTLSAAAFARGNESRARVLHASPDAPSVDIRVANGGPYLFTNVPFKGVGDYLTVPGTDTLASRSRT